MNSIFTFMGGLLCGVISGGFWGVAILALCIAQKDDVRRCSECGCKLTDEEIYYYGCTCEKCERRWLESDLE